MWELDHKESWALKNWCFQTVVLEKTLESPLDYMETKPVNPEGNKSWIFIGRIDAEAETPILWLPNVKNWLIGKAPDAGKDWRQEKGMTEDEIFGWHHQPKGHEFEQALGVGDGQESPWRSRSQTWLSNWTELNWTDIYSTAQKVKVKSLSRVRLFVTLWTVDYRLLCPLNSPGKNSGVDCQALLQGIFPTQGLIPHLLHLKHWKWILYLLSHPGKPFKWSIIRKTIESLCCISEANTAL